MVHRLELRALGDLDQYKTHPQLLAKLIEGVGCASLSQLEKAMFEKAREIRRDIGVKERVTRNFVKEPRNLTNPKTRAVLEKYQVFFDIEKSSPLGLKWFELIEATAAFPVRESEAVDEISAEGKGASINGSVARPSPEVTSAETRPIADRSLQAVDNHVARLESATGKSLKNLHRSRLPFGILATAILVSLSLGGWFYMDAGARGAIRSHLTAILDDVFGRPLAYSDVGLTSYDWITALPKNLVAKVDAAQRWPVVEVAILKDDPLALTLGCFGLAFGRAGQGPDAIEAKALCERAKGKGEGRAEAYLIEVAKLPVALTLADLGIADAEWDTASSDEIVGQITDLSIWTRIDEATKRGDRLALALACFHAIKNMNLQLEMQHCSRASEMGEGRATAALAINAGDGEVARGLLLKAIGQGAFYGRVQLATLISQEGLTSENEAAFFEQFEAIDTYLRERMVLKEDLYFLYATALQADFDRVGKPSDPDRAVTLAGLMWQSVSPDLRGNLLNVTASAAKTALLSAILKVDTLLTVGKLDAPVHLYLVHQFSCERCRTFVQDDLPKLKSAYVDSGLLSITFIPDWRSSPSVERNWQYDDDVAMHVAIACMPAEKRLSAIGEFANMTLSTDDSEALKEIVAAGRRLAGSASDFDDCFNSDTASKVLASRIDFYTISGGKAGDLFINSTFMFEADYDSIAKVISDSDR